MIRLSDELGTALEKPGVGDLGLVEHSIDISVLREIERRESWRRVVRCRLGERAGLDHWRTSEVVVDDGLAVGLGNRLGGHCDQTRGYL